MNSSLATRIKNWWQHYAKLLKLLFVASVIIFVITALGSFLKDVDWHRVGIGLASQSPIHVLMMLIGGCISIVPMLGYDFAITHFLSGRFSKHYIIRSGWITNTLTNVAGFGGLLGATLRAYFYGKHSSKKQVLFAISKIAIFLLSGLSILCWLALAVPLLVPNGHHFDRYIVWLVGGGLYFPIVFIFTRLQNSSFFKDLTPKLELFIVASSTGEWLLVALFFLMIGWLLDVKINLLLVLPMYVVAQLLGVISMLPGAIGSFDIIMLMELSMLGVDRSTALVWLVFFRVFYYLVPLTFGALLFVYHFCQKINRFFKGLPNLIWHQSAHVLITVFMYFSGILMLIDASLPDLTENSRFLQRFYPFTFFFLHQLSTVLFAIAMLACARGVQAKLKKAYWPSLILLLIGMVNTLWNLGTWGLTIYLLILLLLVLTMRHALYREKMAYSLGKAFSDGIVFVGIFILYIIIGIVNEPNYYHHHKIPQFMFFPGESLWFSGFIGLILGILVMLAILRYFTSGYDPFNGYHSFDAQRCRQLIERFGGNETSHLAFLRDKNLYYYQVENEDRLFFMYRRKYDKLIIMGEPVGDQSVLHDALRQFIVEADRYGYQLVFYEVGQSTTMLLHEFGFDFLKTGEDGLVKLADFTLAGKRQRSQRALMHKFGREGYTFDVVEPPFNQDLLKELKHVSDSWLGKQVEKGFSLGFFDEYYLQQAPIAIVKNQDQQIVAFATLMPTGGKQILTIDLMRHDRDLAPSGIMDMIFVNLFLYGQKVGYEYFDLGMAPLSNVGESQFSFIEEKAAHFIYEYGYRLYGFQGLRNYKEKYADIWLSRYTVYRKKSSLVGSMLALVSVVNQRSNPDHSRRLKPQLIEDILKH